MFSVSLRAWLCHLLPCMFSALLDFIGTLSIGVVANALCVYCVCLLCVLISILLFCVCLVLLLLLWVTNTLVLHSAAVTKFKMLLIIHRLV